MIKLSYKYKLLLSFTATFAVFAAVLVAFEMSHEQSYSARLLRERLQCYADLAAGIMERDTGKVATKKIEHFVSFYAGIIKSIFICAKDARNFLYFEILNRVEGILNAGCPMHIVVICFS